MFIPTHLVVLLILVLNLLEPLSAQTADPFCPSNSTQCSNIYSDTLFFMEEQEITLTNMYLRVQVSATASSGTFADVFLDVRTASEYFRIPLPKDTTCFSDGEFSCFNIDSLDIQQAAIFSDSTSDGLCLDSIAMYKEEEQIEAFAVDASFDLKGDCVYLKDEATLFARFCWNLDGSGNCVCPEGKENSANQREYCQDCTKGKYNDISSLVCQSWVSGSYSDDEGATACTGCPEGTYDELGGRTSADDCVQCSAGRWSNQIGRKNDFECTACSTGRYSTQLGATMIETCLQCPPGKYNDQEAGSSLADCIDCPMGTYNGNSGSSELAACLACPAGTYSSTLGAVDDTFCVGCEPGTWSSTVGAQDSSVCIACEAGKYQDSIDQTSEESCVFCNLGKYGNAEGAYNDSVCVNCPPGKSGVVQGISSESECDLCAQGTRGLENEGGCIDCLPGTFQNDTGKFECFDCPAGTYSLTSAKMCIHCLPGTFSGAVSDRCGECLLSTYTDQTGSETCSACPLGSITAELGSDNLALCYCQPGRYGRADLGRDCVQCPISPGANCPGATEFPIISEGYWISDDLLLVTKCSPAEACLLSDDGTTTCAVGYTGEYCAECIQYEYYRLSGRCEKCPGNNYLLWFALTVLVFVGVFVLLKSSIAFARKTHSLGIVITWIQVISLYGSLPIQWPSSVRTMYDYASLVNFNIELFSPDCSVPMEYWVKWGLQLSFPLVFAAVMLMFLAFHTIWSRFFHDFPSIMATPVRDLYSFISTRNRGFLEFQDPYRHSRYVYGFTLIMTVCYTFLVSKTIQPLNCARQDDGTWRMTYNITEICYTKQWYIDTLPPVLGAVLIYIIGIPVFTIWVLYKYRHSTNSPLFLSLYGGLTLPYRDRFVWFEAVNMVRKAIIAILLEFNGSFRSKSVHIFTTEAVLFAIMFIQFFLRPYTMTFNNSLAFMWILVSIFCLFTGIIFDSENLFEWEKEVFATIVLAMFCSALVLSAWALSEELTFYKAFGEKSLLEAGNSKRNEIVSTQHFVELQNSRRKLLASLFPQCHREIFDHLYLLPSDKQAIVYGDLDLYEEMREDMIRPKFGDSTSFHMDDDEELMTTADTATNQATHPTTDEPIYGTESTETIVNDDSSDTCEEEQKEQEPKDSVHDQENAGELDP